MKNFNNLYETPVIIVMPLDGLDIITLSDNDATWDENWGDSYTFI